MIAMKILLLPAFVLVCTLSLSFSMGSKGACKAKQIAKSCKKNILPFKYDSYAVNDITFSDKPQNIEVEFSAFSGQKYKLVFCTSGFTEEVQLNIYDKPAKNKKRNKVYDNDKGIDNLFWSFEPPKSGTYYITYSVPPAKDGKPSSGCIVMMVGYM
jgi:hypothetical protein